MSLVLVTGATGFVGSHVVDHVLRAGFSVRATARSGKPASLRSAYAEYGNKFEVAEVEDLATSDLSTAFKGVGALVHVGSPLPGSVDAETMIRSTIEGTRRVLNYAREAGVKKIVVTGTFGNTHHPNEAWAPKAFSDDDWNPQTIEDAKQPETHPWAIYTASKVIGEREVWKFADANKDIDVTTVLPGFIFGPYGRGQSGTETIGGTFGWVAALIYGEKGRTVPVNSAPFSPNYVHVSDVAALHVAALKAAPAAPGTHKRVLAVGGTVLWPEVSEYLGKSRPQLKDRLGVIPQGYKASIDFAKFENKYASSLFGFRSFKGWEETFGDAVDALLAKEEAITYLIVEGPLYQTHSATENPRMVDKGDKSPEPCLTGQTTWSD